MVLYHLLPVVPFPCDVAQTPLNSKSYRCIVVGYKRISVNWHSQQCFSDYCTETFVKVYFTSCVLNCGPCWGTSPPFSPLHYLDETILANISRPCPFLSKCFPFQFMPLNPFSIRSIRSLVYFQPSFELKQFSTFISIFQEKHNIAEIGKRYIAVIREHFQILYYYCFCSIFHFGTSRSEKLKTFVRKTNSFCKPISEKFLPTCKLFLILSKHSIHSPVRELRVLNTFWNYKQTTIV